MNLFRRLGGGLLMAVVLFGVTTAQAQLQPGGETVNFADPPARVGRVSFMEGAVSFRPDDGEPWAQALLNYPVTTGNAFWTEPGARAEVRFGEDALRIDGETELDIDRLDDQALLVTVRHGTVNVRVASVREGEMYRVTTPRGVVEVTEAGSYRIEAGDVDRPTVVAVLRGQARFEDDYDTTVTSGLTAYVSGNDPDNYAFQVLRTAQTPFDDWSFARDNYGEPRQAVRYVSTGMTGYEDLDTYGEWFSSPEYGPVWTPAAVSSDWAPYRDGHWEWVAPWGWTWIDNAPWGFAPFHYGRWVLIGHRWCWWPGERVVRPVYAPALVTFITFTDTRTVFIDRDRHHRLGPHVGWFPLGPGEAFRPGFRTSNRRLHEINANVVRGDITTNRGYRYRNMATVVSRDDFSSSRHIANVAVPVAAPQLEKASVVGAAPPVEAPPRAERHRESGPEREMSRERLRSNKFISVPRTSQDRGAPSSIAAPPVREAQPEAARPASPVVTTPPLVRRQTDTGEPMPDRRKGRQREIVQPSVAPVAPAALPPQVIAPSPPQEIAPSPPPVQQQIAPQVREAPQQNDNAERQRQENRGRNNKQFRVIEQQQRQEMPQPRQETPVQPQMRVITPQPREIVVPQRREERREERREIIVPQKAAPQPAPVVSTPAPQVQTAPVQTKQESGRDESNKQDDRFDRRKGRGR